ncbi:hypothetical protein GR247_31370 [Rhizobium leguminosarum]|nr:hypothetical protein [Rhizobium leguminosarum]
MSDTTHLKSIEQRLLWRCCVDHPATDIERWFSVSSFQSPDVDFDDTAHVQCRSAGQDCQAEISSDELAGI